MFGTVWENVPGISKVGNNSHSKQLEASLKEEDNGEDSIEVVKAVHQEGLRLKPGRKLRSEYYFQHKKLFVFVQYQLSIVYSILWC